MELVDNQTDTRFPLGDSLEDINNAHTTAYIPVIIFAVLNIAVGLTGNCLSVIFFSQKLSKSAFYYFVAAVSLNDVLVNFALILQIFMVTHYVNFTSLIVCQVFYFFIHWLVGNSLLFIAAISVDRFRRVIFPFAKQITAKIARNIVAGISLFSLSISVHYFYTCTIENLEFPNGSNSTVVGYLCALSKEHPQATVKKIFHIMDMCLHVASIGFLIISYILIVRKLILLRTTAKMKIRFSARGKRSQDTTSPSKITYEEDSVDVEAVDHVSNETKNQQMPKPPYECQQPVEISPPSSKIAVGQNVDSSALSETERRFSETAFVITVASVLCFLPYYVNMLTIKPNLDGKSLVYSVTEMLTRRSYMLNSTVNPLIMLYFNFPFREFVVNILCCLCKKCQKLK